MTDLADISDEALQDEIDRRTRRRDLQKESAAVTNFVHAVCMDTTDGLHGVFSRRLRALLGQSDYDLFLKNSGLFVVDITAGYIGNR